MNNYDITKNYYVTASAGTGKTYNIIEIVKELIKNNVLINRILIVTYTEKAVEELKHRIRKEISGIDASNCEIYTIHSFCQKSIREYAVSCKMPTGLDVIDESEVEDFVDRYIRDEKIYQEIISLKEKCLVDAGKIIKILMSLIKRYYLNKDGKIDDNIISIDNQKLVFAKTYDDLKKIDLNLYRKIELLNQDSAPDNAKAIYNDIKNSFGKSLDGLFTASINLNQFKSKKDEEYKNLLKELREINNSFSSVEVRIALKYIDDLYLKWQEEKKSRQVQTFNDMIRTVREEVVSGGALKTKIQNAYDYAIIDEFQDTNGLQWDIFKNLFLDDKHRIVVVGDEKQSIYSFQGADVEVYKKAIQDIHDCGGYHETLTNNYRSSMAIITATNELFATDGFFSNFDKSNYPIYEDRKKEKNAIFDNKEFKPLVIAYNDLSEKGIREYEYARIVAKKIVDCVTLDSAGKTRLQIMDEDTGKYRNVTFRDITILSKRRDEVIAIKRELKKIGIPFSGYKDDSLFTGIECAHWIALLGAIDAPDFTGKNRKLFKRALFTKFFGHTIKDISDDKYDRDDLDEMDLIKKWKLTLSTERYEDFIDSIIVDSNIDVRMSELNDIQSLSIYKQIGNYAIEYLSSGHTLRELIRELEKKQNRDSTGAKDDNLVETSTDFDCVQLMTIHASKGLEFPVVIFAGNLRGYKNLDESVIYHRNGKPVITTIDNEEHKKESSLELKRLFYVAFTRAKYLLIIPDYKTVKDKNGYDFLNGVIKNYRENHSNYFDGVDYHKFIVDYDVEKLKNIVKDIIKNDNKEVDTFTKEKQDEIIKSLIKDKKNKLAFKHSYSSLSHGNNEISLDEEEREKEGNEIIQDLSLFDNRGIYAKVKYEEVIKEEVPVSFPAGSSIGNAIHEVFEKLDYANYKEDDLTNLIINSFTKEGIKLESEWISYTIKLVNNVLEATLPVIKGSKQVNEWFNLNSITKENKKTETEFNFNLFNEEKLRDYANGFIDLLIRRGDYYSILDWKSDRLNEEDLFSYASSDDLFNHTNNRYSIQRTLYAYCLIKWLKNFYVNSSYEEIFENHFGGVYYVYVRGCTKDTSNGILAKTWSSYKELEKSFNEIMKSKIWRKR